MLVEPNDRWEKALIPMALQNLTSRHPELDIQVNYTILPYNDAREQMLKAMLTPSVRTYLKRLVLSNIDRYFNQIIYKRVQSERPSNEEINAQVWTKIDGFTFDWLIKKMENYQKVGLVTGIIGIVSSLVILRSLSGFFVYFGGGMFVASMISVTILVPVSSSGKHRKTVGIIVLLMGVFFNWLLIIPGIMALRYKPKTF